MTEAGLSLRSQCGVPTFYPANTTIDLTWVSATCLDWVVTCLTDVEHQYSHLSDHAAIATTINLPSAPTLANRTCRNWKQLDAPAFESHLAPNLRPVLEVLKHPATDQAGIDAHTHLLTTMVVQTMERWAPRLPIRPGAKRWWDKETLNPLKATAQRLRRLYQRRRDEPTRLDYQEVAQAYRLGIHTAKRQHWRSFLDSLTPSTPFTASKYATSSFAAPSLVVPALSTPSGGTTSDPEEQAELLFQGTSAPTVPCELSDILPPLSPNDTPSTTLFLQHDIDLVISALKPGKAPGRDDITNQAIQAGGEGLATDLLYVANSYLLLGYFP